MESDDPMGISARVFIPVHYDGAGNLIYAYKNEDYGYPSACIQWTGAENL